MATTPNSYSWVPTLLNGIAGAYGANQSASDASAGMGAGINTQQGLQTTLGNLYSPQRSTGNAAFTGLTNMLGLNGSGTPNYAAFDNSPGFQYATQLGTQAINRQAAASGDAYTPNTLDAVGNYVQGMASQNYDNYMQQLLQTAGYGASGNANLGQNLYGIGANISQLQQGQGNANATGTAGTAGAIGQAATQMPWGNIISSIGSWFNGSNNSGIGIPAGQTTALDSLGGANPFGSNGGWSAPSLSTVNPSSLSNPYGSTVDLSSLGAGGNFLNSPGSGTAPSSGANTSGAWGASAPTLSTPLLNSSTLGNPGFNASMTSLGNSMNNSVSQELGTTNSSGSSFGGAGIGSDLSNAGGVVSGLQQGGATGYGSAAIHGAALASTNNAFGANTGAVDKGIGAASNLLGAYQGFKQGGVIGDTSGIANLAQAAGNANMLGSASSAVATGAGYVAAPLALYNFANNWQSGATGSDALNGAETGATIGSVVPGIGTAIGAVIGGAAGALSSAFGGGKMDPENSTWNSFAPAFAKNPNLLQGASPSQTFQLLSGVFDAKNNSPGHAEEIEQTFGRMGENNFLTQMTNQINSALHSGAISKTATPQQIYNQVVTPWLKSKGDTIGSSQGQNTAYTITGAKEGPALQAVLQQLIGQWQNGAITNQTPLGIAGQKVTGLQAFGAAPTAAAATPSASVPATAHWYGGGSAPNAMRRMNSF